jgi:K+-sensing histidine kinase KdpD
MSENRMRSLEKRRTQVVVCVTGQRTCARLIQEGAALAKPADGKVSVVHVAEQGAAFLGSASEGEALEYLFRAADEVGADMTVLRAEDVMDTLATFAREREADCVVLGVGPGREYRDFTARLRTLLPDVEVYSVYAR